MKITDFTKQDAIHMANLLAIVTHSNKLIDAMRVAGIHMTGNAVASKEETLAWAKELATHMAIEIQGSMKKEEDKKASPAPAKMTKLPPLPPKKKKK
jgi:hypothetical protein